MSSEVWMWLIGLVVVIVLGLLAIYLPRRWKQREDDAAKATRRAGFDITAAKVDGSWVAQAVNVGDGDALKAHFVEINDPQGALLKMLDHSSPRTIQPGQRIELRFSVSGFNSGRDLALVWEDEQGNPHQETVTGY